MIRLWWRCLASRAESRLQREWGFKVTGEVPAPKGAEPGRPNWQVNQHCLERFAEAGEHEYHPSCCRFPKSCSALELQHNFQTHDVGEGVSIRCTRCHTWKAMWDGHTSCPGYGDLVKP